MTGGRGRAASAGHGVARHLLGRVLVVGMLALLAAGPSAAEVPVGAATPTVFIVTCRCATAARRGRVADAVRRRGGTIVYTYDTLPGLAVASPRGADAHRFMAWLRRIATVTDVRVSGTYRLQSTNG